MTACPLDGSNRIAVQSDRYSTVWKCSWCGQHSIEEFEPTSANDLQREWGS